MLENYILAYKNYILISKILCSQNKIMLMRMNENKVKNGQ